MDIAAGAYNESVHWTACGSVAGTLAGDYSWAITFTSVANYRTGVEDTDAFRVGSGWLRLGWAPGEAHRVQIAVAHQEADHVLYPYLLMDARYHSLGLPFEYALSILATVVSRPVPERAMLDAPTMITGRQPMPAPMYG